MFVSQSMICLFLNAKKKSLYLEVMALSIHMLWKSTISVTAHKTPVYIKE